jgi:uncharacterized membrane protein YiaA
MGAKGKILNAVSFVGITVLSVGVIVYLIGLFVNGYNMLVPIGIGTGVGAVFIFLIGVFFVATEEMLEKSYKGAKIVPFKPKKGAPL